MHTTRLHKKSSLMRSVWSLCFGAFDGSDVWEATIKDGCPPSEIPGPWKQWIGRSKCQQGNPWSEAWHMLQITYSEYTQEQFKLPPPAHDDLDLRSCPAPLPMPLLVCSSASRKLRIPPLTLSTRSCRKEFSCALSRPLSGGSVSNNCAEIRAVPYDGCVEIRSIHHLLWRCGFLQWEPKSMLSLATPWDIWQPWHLPLLSWAVPALAAASSVPYVAEMWPLKANPYCLSRSVQTWKPFKRLPRKNEQNSPWSWIIFSSCLLLFMENVFP